jgi:hypothetical protein
MSGPDPILIEGQGDFARADDPQGIAMWRLWGVIAACASLALLATTVFTVNTRDSSATLTTLRPAAADSESAAAGFSHPTPKPPTSPAGLASASPAAVGASQETR